MSESAKTHYDIAIIGGGLAGLTMACALGASGMKITVIDQGSATPRPDSDLRTTAISYGSQKTLEDAGIWQNLPAEPSPIKNIEILDGSSPVLLNFLSEEVEGRSFGWILLNYDLRVAMMQTLATHKNITHIAETKVSNLPYLYDSIAFARELVSYTHPVCAALK